MSETRCSQRFWAAGYGWVVTLGWMLPGCPVAVDDRYALEPVSSTPAACSDGIQNGAESDLDCGGAECAPCGPGQLCREVRDCRSSLCSDAVCQPQNCADGVYNGTETAPDCGGPECPLCTAGQSCITGTDCESWVCENGVCA